MKTSRKRIWYIIALIVLCLAINRYEHIQQHRVAGDFGGQRRAEVAKPPTTPIVHHDCTETLVFETAPSRHIGYAGETPLRIAISRNDSRIISVSFLPNEETPGYITMIERHRSRFMESWDGLTVIEAINEPVDAITGATMTTVCVIYTLRDDLKQRIESGYFATEGINTEGVIVRVSKSWKHYAKLFTSLLVLGIALLSFFLPKKMSPFRLYFLALLVIVLGFWQGQYLSVTHFINILSYGFNWTVWIIPLLVLLAFALPLIFKKPFYCMHVCPFGAAQELVAKTNKKHIQIPQKIYRILKYQRPLFLLVIIGLLFSGILSDFTNFEPFTAFTLNINFWIPMIIAGVFLLLSVFIPKFWCKYCCPTGYMIDMTFKV
jgi:hypothetical protein